MKHKIYLIISIVLPIILASFATGDLIRYASNNGTTMNPVISALTMVVFFAMGIMNLWALIKKSEGNE